MEKVYLNDLLVFYADDSALYAQPYYHTYRGILVEIFMIVVFIALVISLSFSFRPFRIVTTFTTAWLATSSGKVVTT